MADKVLVLGFKTKTSEANVSLTINRPASQLTPAHIKAAMQTMIAQESFGANVTTAGGYKEYELIGTIASAKYVSTEDTAYEFE